MFTRLADQHRQFVKDLIVSLQALAIVLERRGYVASCYTCGDDFESASFMVSLQDGHLIRFLVSECATSWTEMRDDRELMKLDGGEAIAQLQELADMVKELTVQSGDVQVPFPDGGRVTASEGVGFSNSAGTNAWVQVH